MSAIAGIFNLDAEPVAPGRLELLTGAMQAHGPDGTHHYRAGAVALGHCLLRSRPLAANVRQPLVAGDLALVFDGRIDNRAELSARLGVESPALADAELVLAAYREWGRECLSRLAGEYVFGLWNAEERCLFLAKDRIGARQIYYTVAGNCFAFASFDEALLVLPGVAREPCAELVAAFLVPEFDGYRGEQSWLEAVRALQPAHSLCVSPAGVAGQQRYWSFEPKVERRFESDAEFAAAFEQVFKDAVAKRVRGIAEPALLVSGGIDSASVLATLEATVPEPDRPLHAYSVLLEPVEASPESRAIVGMTASERIRPHVLRIPAFSGPVGFDDLMSMIWARAHPVDNALVIPALLSLAAQRAGHRSLLHGASGDVVLAAPSNYAAPLLRAGHWRTAWREYRAASQHHTYLMGERPSGLLLRSLWSAFAPDSLLRLVRSTRNGWARPPVVPAWVHPDFARRVHLVEGLRAARARAVEHSLAPRHTAHARSTFHGSGVSSGLAGFQRVGSLRGVEMLDPWADQTVLEFVLELPASYLVRHGWTKWPARQWLLRKFGPEVRWRSDKEHFGWRFVETVMAASGQVIEDSLATAGKVGEFVNVPALRALLASPDRAPEASPTETLYDVVTLIQWLGRVRG